MVILSPDSVRSNNVLDEISYALESGKRVIPVLYQPCEIPFRLRRVQYVNLTDDYGKGVSRLKQALSLEPAHARRPLDPPPPAGPAERQAPGVGPHAPSAREMRAYARPAAAEPRFKSAIRSAVAGSAAGVLAVLPFFPEDWLVAAVIGAAAWAIIGAIAGSDPRVWRATLILAAVGLAGWFGVDDDSSFGDRSARAVVFGAPVGGFLGALLGRVWPKRT